MGACKSFLDQLRNDTATCNEVNHRNWKVAVGVGLGRDLRRVAYKALGELIGKGRDLINHNKWITNDGGLYSGGSAGYYAGPGMVKRFTGVRNEMKIGKRRR